MSNDLLHDYHLNRDNYCRRLIRLRELSCDEVRTIENSASRTVGKDATNMELRNETLRLGVRSMLVAVSSPMENPQKTDLHVLTEQEKETPSNPYYFDKLFGPKDEAFLAKKWTDFHEITKDDVEFFEGKASTVLKE